MVSSGPGRVIATLTFDFDAEGRITALRNVVDPDGLHAVADGTAYDIGTR
jgi:RNA polymerase sigma-70 factor (ECF subfamily)